jgi:hypothetical protein
MAGRNYWLDLFTAVTWQEFLDAGGKVSGFRESRWSALQKVKPGDYFLCYVTGISRWIGLLEVTSEAFRDTATVWKDESFPCRVKVKVVAKLTPETGVPVKDMKDFKLQAVPWLGRAIFAVPRPSGRQAMARPWSRLFCRLRNPQWCGRLIRAS